MPTEFKLGYTSPEQFMNEVNPTALQRGDRVSVRLEGGTNYIFTYVNTVKGDLHGRSSLNNRQVSVNAIDMILTEHDN